MCPGWGSVASGFTLARGLHEVSGAAAAPGVAPAEAVPGNSDESPLFDESPLQPARASRVAAVATTASPILVRVMTVTGTPGVERGYPCRPACRSRARRSARARPAGSAHAR